MRTTIVCDDHLFKDVMTLTAAKNKTEAVRQALQEYVRLKRKEQLLSMRGRLEITDNWLALRSLELAEGQHG